MPRRLLRSLSLLALAAAVAGPLAAFEIDSIEIAPAAPTSDDFVVVTVTGESLSPCFFFGAERFGPTIDLWFSSCFITPIPGRTPFSYSEELGALPAGTYLVRTVFDEQVDVVQFFTVTTPEGPCTPGATALCLGERRFRVETEWTANGGQGQGQAIPWTGESGSFSFFHPDNTEVTVKVIDGCALNGHFWVFAAGLTDVATELVVTDETTGASRTYRNPARTPFAPIQDTTAFPCP